MTKAASTLTDRYAANLSGVLSCYERIIITGTLPGACYAAGMTSFLYAMGIRIFDYPRFAEPLRERIRQRAQEACAAAGVQIEHVSKSHIRKEDIVARVLHTRGEAPGLVHAISAMEGCPSYKPWHDKTSGKTFLRPEQGKCLHYYFYLIDEDFGLCYLRVPTWAPFGLQFYCNGHSALARQLQLAEVFVQDDWHGSIRQAEYSTDLMFRSSAILTQYCLLRLKSGHVDFLVTKPASCAYCPAAQLPSGPPAMACS